MTLYQIVQHFPMFECHVVGNFLEVCSVQVGVNIHDALLSDTTYLLVSFEQSTPPQKHQLNVLIRTC